MDLRIGKFATTLNIEGRRRAQRRTRSAALVPRAVPLDYDWHLGMTAEITGLTSAAGSAFNGVLGRISDSIGNIVILSSQSFVEVIIGCCVI